MQTEVRCAGLGCFPLVPANFYRLKPVFCCEMFHERQTTLKTSRVQNFSSPLSSGVVSATWKWTTSQQASTTSPPPPSCPNRKVPSSWTSPAPLPSRSPSSNKEPRDWEREGHAGSSWDPHKAGLGLDWQFGMWLGAPAVQRYKQPLPAIPSRQICFQEFVWTGLIFKTFWGWCMMLNHWYVILLVERSHKIVQSNGNGRMFEVQRIHQNFTKKKKEKTAKGRTTLRRAALPPLP